jgi:hypothetical protein
MKYEIPQLLLVGSAKHIVLGANPSMSGPCIDDENPGGIQSDIIELW